MHRKDVTPKCHTMGWTSFTTPYTKGLFTFVSSKVVEFNWTPATAVYVTSGKAAASIGFTTPCKTAIMKTQTPVVHALEQEAESV